MLSIILVLTLFLFAGGCTKKAELLTVQNFKTLQEELTAVGIALPDKTLEGVKKRRKNAYKKAKKMAQEELSNILLGLTLMDGRAMKHQLAEDEKRMKKFIKLLKKAEEIEVNWGGGEGCSVKLKINKKFLEKKLGVKFK